MSTSSPKRPYLLRAFYEWILDNGMTPHIMVDATADNVSVPRQFVKDGSIVLNISPTACHGLMMRNDEVTFSARFGGTPFPIWVPMSAVTAIYSRETQEGISFPTDEYASGASANGQDGGDEPPKPPKKARPALRVVK